MCQHNNYYVEEHAVAEYAYKVVHPFMKRVGRIGHHYKAAPGEYVSKWQSTRYTDGKTYTAKGTTPHREFVQYDELSGGAFHVYPSLSAARRAKHPDEIVIKVAVADYVASGYNGSTTTACYRRMQIIGEV
jgi:hypothetical protein